MGMPICGPAKDGALWKLRPDPAPDGATLQGPEEGLLQARVAGDHAPLELAEAPAGDEREDGAAIQLLRLDEGTCPKPWLLPMDLAEPPIILPLGIGAELVLRLEVVLVETLVVDR